MIYNETNFNQNVVVLVCVGESFDLNRLKTITGVTTPQELEESRSTVLMPTLTLDP